MPDSISINIPLDWRVPGQYLEIDHSRAARGLPSGNRQILIIGQRLANATIPALTLTTITRAADAATYFGRGSMIDAMVRAAMRVNSTSKINVLALDDLAAGVAATKTITVAGSATMDGTLNLLVAATRIPVAVTKDMTATALAANIAAAINANGDLPVTATAAQAVVTVTARHKGECGNDIDIRTNYYNGETTPNGITVTIANGVVGTGNPDILTAIAAMASGSFYTIIMPYTDIANMTAMEGELVKRWGGMDMRTGHVFTAKYSTIASLSAWGAARNSPHSTVFGLNKSPTPPWVLATQAAAAIELSGSIDPAIPFTDLSLPDILPPSEADRFTATERNLGLFDGISSVKFDQSGACAIEQTITTYQTNASGFDDTSLLKLNTKWTVDYIRFAMRVAVARDHNRCKLADDDVLDQIRSGQKIVTPKLLRNTLVATAAELAANGLLENLAGFKTNLIVRRSETNRDRVNAILPPDIVNQFDVFAGSVQYVL